MILTAGIDQYCELPKKNTINLGCFIFKIVLLRQNLELWFYPLRMSPVMHNSISTFTDLEYKPNQNDCSVRFRYNNALDSEIMC